ncbi:hypothetical protein Tco_0551070 [Tanacetum coccineum]
MPTQNEEFTLHLLPKMIFGNEKGWKGFSRGNIIIPHIDVQRSRSGVKKQRSKRSKRKDTEVPQPSSLTTNVADEVVNEEMDDSLERAATTATGLEVSRRDSGSGLRHQENMGDTIAQTRVGSSRRVESSKDKGLGEEDASKQGRKANIDANEDIYLFNVQTDEDMFGVNDLDGDEVIVESVYVVKTAEETRSMVEEVTTITILVSAATTTTITTAITDVEMTLAQALAELKSAKPKATAITTTPTLTTITAVITTIAISTRPIAKGIVIHKLEQAPTPIVSSQQPSQVKIQDKGKGKMVEPEPVKKMSKKELLRLDEELAFKLQAEEEEEEEEERIAKEKAQQIEETNIA